MGESDHLQSGFRFGTQDGSRDNSSNLFRVSKSFHELPHGLRNWRISDSLNSFQNLSAEKVDCLIVAGAFSIDARGRVHLIRIAFGTRAVGGFSALPGTVGDVFLGERRTDKVGHLR